MTEYRGLFIGGPMDGKYLTHDAPQWDYHKSPESLNDRPIDYSNMTAVQAAQRAESEVGRYYYTDVTFLGMTGHSGGRRMGFWVEDGKTIDDALTALLTRYTEPRRHVGLLKRAGRILMSLLRAASHMSETEFREARDTIQEIERETGHEV